MPGFSSVAVTTHGPLSHAPGERRRLGLAQQHHVAPGERAAGRLVEVLAGGELLRPRACTSSASNAWPSWRERGRAGPSRLPARKARRSRSRTTSSRMATDCTRPAESPTRSSSRAAATGCSRPAGRGCAGFPARAPGGRRRRAGWSSASWIASSRDLVEHHAAHRHLRLEHLEQVPGDALALAVFVGGEEKLVGVLERPPSARGPPSFLSGGTT